MVRVAPDGSVATVHVRPAVEVEENESLGAFGVPEATRRNLEKVEAVFQLQAEVGKLAAWQLGFAVLTAVLSVLALETDLAAVFPPALSGSVSTLSTLTQGTPEGRVDARRRCAARLRETPSMLELLQRRSSPSSSTGLWVAWLAPGDLEEWLDAGVGLGAVDVRLGRKYGARYQTSALSARPVAIVGRWNITAGWNWDNWWRDGECVSVGGGKGVVCGWSGEVGALNGSVGVVSGSSGPFGALPRLVDGEKVVEEWEVVRRGLLQGRQAKEVEGGGESWVVTSSSPFCGPLVVESGRVLAHWEAMLREEDLEAGEVRNGTSEGVGAVAVSWLVAAVRAAIGTRVGQYLGWVGLGRVERSVVEDGEVWSRWGGVGVGEWLRVGAGVCGIALLVSTFVVASARAQVSRLSHFIFEHSSLQYILCTDQRLWLEMVMVLFFTPWPWLHHLLFPTAIYTSPPPTHLHTLFPAPPQTEASSALKRLTRVLWGGQALVMGAGEVFGGVEDVEVVEEMVQHGGSGMEDAKVVGMGMAAINNVAWQFEVAVTLGALLRVIYFTFISVASLSRLHSPRGRMVGKLTGLQGVSLSFALRWSARIVPTAASLLVLSSATLMATLALSWGDLLACSTALPTPTTTTSSSTSSSSPSSPFSSSSFLSSSSSLQLPLSSRTAAWPLLAPSSWVSALHVSAQCEPASHGSALDGTIVGWTTVGYGATTPISLLARCFAIVAAFCALFIVSFAAAMLLARLTPTPAEALAQLLLRRTAEGGKAAYLAATCIQAAWRLAKAKRQAAVWVHAIHKTHSHAPDHPRSQAHPHPHPHPHPPAHPTRSLPAPSPPHSRGFREVGGGPAFRLLSVAVEAEEHARVALHRWAHFRHTRSVVFLDAGAAARLRLLTSWSELRLTEIRGAMTLLLEAAAKLRRKVEAKET